jgi:Holliday junction resolvase RusA-like endonuclease
MNHVIVNAFFPDEPTTWKRASARGRRRFNPRAMEKAKETLRWQFLTMYPAFKVSSSSRFGYRAEFNISRRGGDGDNYEKLLLDALTGMIWKDDEQVDEGQWRKRIDADKKGILLVVYVIE